MPTLHILNKPPGHPRFQRCLEALGDGERLLLIESAVLFVSTPGLPGTGNTYVLEADLEARGLAEIDSGGSATIVDYDAMVVLTAESEQIIHW